MRLFKYYAPSEYSFKSLAVKGLWCHHAGNMNDPFDCLGLVNRKFTKKQICEFRKILLENGSDEHKKMLKLDNIQLNKFINQNRSKSIESFAFCALSERQDINLMWSHYSRAHTGFVIELEFPELENNYHLQKIKYHSLMPEFNLTKFAHFLTGDDNLMNYMIQDISIKSIDWNYEREWRIWRRNPSYYYYKPEHLKAIYFGVNADADTKKTVLELTSYLPENSQIYEMEFNENPIKLKY